MTDVNPPLLESKQIIKATLAALILGGLIFVVAVLPAEYGIDPLGTGKALGFSRLYQPDDQTDMMVVQNGALQAFPRLKLEDAGSGPEVPMPAEANNPAPAHQYAVREDSITIPVPAGKGLEYKMIVLKYGKVKYEWSTNQGVLYFDFHGEVKEANPGKDTYFESYTVANSNNMIGTFLAPFEGRHGWYFKNRSKTDIIVTLRLKGQYAL
ncbi:hypothetical protein [Larkinella sp. C7]|uniref:hypothetical protein n=1 Tax=Larkinella sp. C7 TaxID=2576607 RepID=UPI00111123A7|nr:hypothetical protein [Larkinella sp. C7]